MLQTIMYRVKRGYQLIDRTIHCLLIRVAMMGRYYVWHPCYMGFEQTAPVIHAIFMSVLIREVDLQPAYLLVKLFQFFIE
jgi:hypothetical protein